MWHGACWVLFVALLGGLMLPWRRLARVEGDLVRVRSESPEPAGAAIAVGDLRDGAGPGLASGWEQAMSTGS